MIEEKNLSCNDNAHSNSLEYRVNQRPGWKTCILLGFQHTIVAITALLALPYAVADSLCAGSDVIHLRIRLIATNLFMTGISTLLQTTLGYRLPILLSASFAFLPALYVYARLPQNFCNSTINDIVPEEQYLGRLQEIQGCIVMASLFLIFLSASGLIGALSRRISPITTSPLIFLLCLANYETALQQAKQHWISVIMFILLVIFTLLLCDWHVPFPYYSFQKRNFKLIQFRLFGLFPFLTALIIVYIILAILTFSGVIKKNSAASINKEQAVEAFQSAEWFHIPYPGQFGMPKFHLGLFFGMIASTLAATIESLGTYGVLAKVTQERSPPASAINRAFLVQGICACLAGLIGTGVGITTYGECVSAISITRVASRVTVQIAGILLIIISLFTKVSAAIATFPDAVVGGFFSMCVCLVAAVGIANLQTVDLNSNRNTSIMGISLIIGMIIPAYIAENPVNTGLEDMDQILNILLKIHMFVGGIIAFVLDNCVPGATKEQRGFVESPIEEHMEAEDGYAFPTCINRLLLQMPILTNLPFMPSKKRLLLSLSREDNKTLNI